MEDKKNNNKEVLCRQCGKKALYLLGEQKIPLCIDCTQKVNRINEATMRDLERQMNYLTGQIESTTGLYGVLPRYPEPQPIIDRRHISMNTIKIDRSVIGAVNTGEIEKLEVSMSGIDITENKQLASALKEFTEAILKERELEDNKKEEIIEQLSFIASEYAKKPEERRKSLIKPILAAIPTILSNIDKLRPLWDKLSRLLT